MTLTYKTANDATISIYDVSVRVLYRHTLSKEQSALQIQANLTEGVHFLSATDNPNGAYRDGCTTSGEACTEGVYYYALQYTEVKGEVQKLKGFISLFR